MTVRFFLSLGIRYNTRARVHLNIIDELRIRNTAVRATRYKSNSRLLKLR